MDKIHFNGLYFGSKLPVEVEVDQSLNKPHVRTTGGKLLITVPEYKDSLVQNAYQSFLTKALKSFINKRIAKHQVHFKVKPRSIKIETSLKKWGTCNHNRDLTFNWHLATLPKEVVDYVIVHEMCHMVHLNHDRSYWRLVGKICPNYKDSEAWLSKNV